MALKAIVLLFYFSNTSMSIHLMSCGSGLARFARTLSSPSSLKEKTLYFLANLWSPSGMEILKVKNSSLCYSNEPSWPLNTK